MNFEDFIREQIQSVEDATPPEVNWRPEQSWRRIEFTLRGGRSGRVYFHYYLAASISFFLIFSGILGIYRNPKFNGELRAVLDNPLRSLERKENPNQPDWVDPKAPTPLLELASPKLSSVSHVVKSPNSSFAILERKIFPGFETSFSIHPQVNYLQAEEENPRLCLTVQVGAGVVAKTFSPNATLKTAWIMPRPGNTYYTFGASISAFGFLEPLESGNTRLNPAVFLNAEFGRIKGPLGIWSNPGWDVGVGYLVANKSSVLKKGAVRVFTRLPLTKHIKISPELIFADRFKSVLPGITISLG